MAAKKKKYEFEEYEPSSETNTSILIKLPKSHWELIQRLKSAGVHKSNQDAIIEAVEYLIKKYPELDF